MDLPARYNKWPNEINTTVKEKQMKIQCGVYKKQQNTHVMATNMISVLSYLSIRKKNKKKKDKY
jgi:hypothetical protein